MKFNGVVEYTLIYDANGRLYSMTEGATTHVYEYDSLDRLIRAYQKDANGNITVAVENAYDELGRAKGSKYDKVAYNPQQYSIDYKEDSNLISAYTMPGNKVNTYTYDAFERLIQKSHSSNAFTTRFTYLSPSSGKTSTVVSGLEIDTASSDIYYSYTYDNLGNITAVYKNGVLAEAYEYDALGQLTRADNVAANSTVFYEYDKAGNIRYNFVFEYTSESTSSIAFALADSIISYQYTTGAWGDMLTRYGYNGTTVNYDAIGNPLSWRNASSLTWEARRLESAVLSETASIEFEYNSSGIRTKKTYTEVGGNTWNYEYILDGTRILRENIKAYPTSSPGAGTVFSLLYYYDDSGIASIDYDGTRYYYVKNLQGDVIGLVNGSGQFVVQYTYDAWGKVISTTGSMASTLGQYNPFRYRSYYYDTETGFYYLQSRYYDPVVGRFLNADHPELVGANGGVQGYNLFAYCNNDPVMYVDSTGYALRHNTVIINDGGGGAAPKIKEEQPEPQTVSVKNHISTYGSYAVEFDYVYEVYDNKVTSVTLERHKVAQEPPLFSVEIVSARAEIVDWFGVDNAIKFEFMLEITFTMGIPGLPKALEWLSLDFFIAEGPVSTTIAVKEVTNEQND